MEEMEFTTWDAILGWTVGLIFLGFMFFILLLCILVLIYQYRVPIAWVRKLFSRKKPRKNNLEVVDSTSNINLTISSDHKVASQSPDGLKITVNPDSR